MPQLGPYKRLILSETVNVTTAGSPGSATGNTASTALQGYLLGVHLNYDAAAPATTDVTVSYATPSAGNIVVVSNNNTDKFYPVRIQAVDAAAAGISGEYDRPPIFGTIDIAVAQSDAITNCVIATLIYEQA